MNQENQEERIERAIWTAVEALRGSLVEMREAFVVVISVVLLKFIEDIAADRESGSPGVEGEDLWKSLEAPPRLRLMKLRGDGGISLIRLLISAFEEVERINPISIKGVFSNLSVDRAVERIGAINVAAVVDIIDLIDLRPSALPRSFCLGEIYESALLRFADTERGIEFYVPDTVASLIVRLVEPGRGESVYDPFCRAGQLLSAAARYSSGLSLLAGQVPSSREWSLCKINMILHGLSMAQIEVGDALDTPWIDPTRGSSEGFDVVISNPPFGTRIWKHDAGESKRSQGPWGDARNSGDYAYLIHAVESMREGSGRAAIIVSPGVLFRGGGELDIRRKFVEEWIIEAVVTLPANLFSATRIPVSIICLRKGKRTGDILFVDATRGFITGRRRNSLTRQVIDDVVGAFKSFEPMAGFSRRVSLEEVRSNNFNLSVHLYVDQSVVSPSDPKVLWVEIQELERKLSEVHSEVNSYLEIWDE